jgi:glutaredoxin-like protein NrdH
MIEMTFVKGVNKAEIVLYALSTCGWCAKTKRFLDELGVSYSFVDVDLLSSTDSKEARAKIQHWNPQVSFPTIVINDKVCIVGYKPEKVLDAIG